MATYETFEEQTLQDTPVAVQSSQSLNFVPVILQEAGSGTPLMLRTRTELIEGIMPASKGGTGIDTLQGGRFIASNVDGTSLEEVDIPVQYLSGLKSNVQEKLDGLRAYTLVVTTGSWVSDSNGYYKEFTLKGIKSTDNPIIGLLIQSDTSTEVEKEKYAYSCIDKADILDDKVKFRCFDEVPTKEITLNFVCM